MYDYRIVEQVSRKKKHMSGALRKVMVIFADFCLQGFTLFSMPSAGRNMSIFWIITRWSLM